LNLRRKSTKIGAKRNTPRTQVSVDGQVGVGAGAGGGEGPPDLAVVVFGWALGEGELAAFVVVVFGVALGEAELVEPGAVKFALTFAEKEPEDAVVVVFVET
jgi:hypothetical protein